MIESERWHNKNRGNRFSEITLFEIGLACYLITGLDCASPPYYSYRIKKLFYFRSDKRTQPAIAIIAILKLAAGSRKQVALQGWLLLAAVIRMLLLLQSTQK